MPDRQDVDFGGVGEIFDEADKRRKHKKMTPGQQRKAKKDAARTGSKMAYDLPSDVIEAIRAIAKEESVSQTNLVAVILDHWVNAYDAGEIEIDQETKVGARHPQWLYKMEIPRVSARD